MEEGDLVIGGVVVESLMYFLARWGHGYLNRK